MISNEDLLCLYTELWSIQNVRLRTPLTGCFSELPVSLDMGRCHFLKLVSVLGIGY